MPSVESNDLLAHLPLSIRESIRALASTRQVVAGEVLSELGADVACVIFPTSGYVSLVAQAPGTPGVDLCMVGREGMVGVSLALGALDMSLQVIVQGTGQVLEVPVRPLLFLMRNSPKLQWAIQHYLNVQLRQMATSTACKQFHAVAPRLARWLLMCHDRAQSDHLQFSHQFLATMLGVRRVSLTQAASMLKSTELIDYHRGAIQIMNREGLMKAACSCYAADSEAYASLFTRLGK